MPPDAPVPGSAADWLTHARSDLALASVRKNRRVMYEHLCFHAQQAAEKALKAVLAHEGISFGRSHDLAYLLGLLPEGKSIPPPLMELPVLNKYAVQYRYPGEAPVLKAQHRKYAVRLAEDAVLWATLTIK